LKFYQLNFVPAARAYNISMKAGQNAQLLRVYWWIFFLVAM